MRDATQCPKCGGTKFSFSGGWWSCERCGEMEPAAESVVFADHPRLTPDDYPGEGDAA